MSESPPSSDLADAFGGAEGAISPAAIDALLADFRAWLGQPTPPALPPLETPLDWTTLVGSWTALRHEINLQTRASRGLLEALQATPRPAEPADADEIVRPLLKTLLDVHDALALARREVERLQGGAARKRHFLVALVRPWCAAEEAAAKTDALLVGYQMSLQRIERTLQQYGLEPIPCVGEPFDPEQMEAVEVVRDEGRARSEVLDEVRRGYRWRGRVFRFAQVRVARP